jgi:predicted dienelactone hydrolase
LNQHLTDSGIPTESAIRAFGITRTKGLISSFALSCLTIFAVVPTLAAGFSLIEVPSDAGPALARGVWYPCATPTGEIAVRPVTVRAAKDCPIAGQDLPLVVISHGFGGSFVGHRDVAESLADAGFIVAAINHPSDSSRSPELDHKDPLSALTDRPADIKHVVDFMLGAWPSAAKIDRDRIGFFGFSRGGFTGLALIGGEINFRDVLAQWCPEGSMQPGRAEARLHGIPTQPLVHDPRISAAVIADPLLGRFFTTEGLKGVHLPVQLWASEFGGDGVTHYDAAALDRNLAAKPELHTVANAGHFAFLPSCSPGQALAFAQICVDPEAFDRAAFHVEFDRQVVAFFRAHLLPNRENPG